MCLSKRNITLFAFSVFLFMAIRPSHATILLQSDFETGEYGSYGYGTSGNATTSIVGSPEPVCHGNYSAKFSLAFTDPVTYRTELTLNQGPLKEFKIGREYWIGFAIFLPNSWAPDSSPEVLFQFHGRPDRDQNGDYIEEWRNPPFAIRTNETTWLATYLKDSKKITVNKNYEKSGAIDMGAFKTGRWTNFVIHTKWTYTPDGFIEVFKDGQMVAKINGGIGFNDDTGPYLKFGIYKKVWDLSTSWGHATDVSARTHYIDHLLIGDAASSYDEVAPPTCQLKETAPSTPSGLSIRIQ